MIREHINIYEPIQCVEISGMNYDEFASIYRFKQCGEILYNHNLIINTNDRNNNHDRFWMLVLDNNIIDYEMINAMIDDGIISFVKKGGHKHG